MTVELWMAVLGGAALIGAAIYLGLRNTMMVGALLYVLALATIWATKKTSAILS